MAKTEQVVVMGGWRIGEIFRSLIAVLIGVLIVTAVYLTRDSNEGIIREDHETTHNSNSLARCDFFSGKWIYDNESYPLYREQQCSFIPDGFACEELGRKDLKYQQWRWQPHGCDLPRFNARALLEKLRGKRLVFVGDSLNKNQWVSLTCLVESSIPPELRSRSSNESLLTFKATEYNVSIDFYWAPFLVESNCDDSVVHHLLDRIVIVEAIEKHAKHWTNADILIFDSYIWWLDDKMKVLWGSFEKSNGILKEVELLSRYKMGLMTWADWLETHVNRSKTKLFFVSMSSMHFRGEEWGMDANQTCYNETEPIFKEGYWGNSSNPKIMEVVEATIDRLKKRGVNVHLLNITQLSEYRKDGHPSIYRMGQSVNLTKEELSKPPSVLDCVHWCLPGVPDVWNELLYAYIFHY